MDIVKTIKLISLVQRKDGSYEEIVELLFGEKPPLNNDFLSRIDLGVISEVVASEAYRHSLRWEERPNKYATIGFVIHYPFQYYIYKNIHRHLPNSEFILNASWIIQNVKDSGTLIALFQ